MLSRQTNHGSVFGYKIDCTMSGCAKRHSWFANLVVPGHSSMNPGSVRSFYVESKYSKEYHDGTHEIHPTSGDWIEQQGDLY